MGDDDFKLAHWRKDVVGSSTSTGKCAAWSESDDLKNSTSAPGYGKETGKENALLDYYVCGGGSSSHAQCKGLSFAEWGGSSGIWKNCKQRGSKDPCWNMIHDGLPNNEKPGSKFYAARDSAKYDPVTDNWSNGEDQDDGFKDDWQDGARMNLPPHPNAHLPGYTAANDVQYRNRWNQGPPYPPSPAYPTEITKLNRIGNRGGTAPLETKEDVDPNACPAGYRDFKCAGDGSSEDDGSSTPGCGSGAEWNDQGLGDTNGWQDTIRFCARSTEDYLTDNLMDCCLGDKGDIKDTGFKNCPVGYCRTSISQTDIIADNPCVEGKGTDLTCYEMTDKCNDLFTEECTAELFNNDDTLQLGKQAKCRKWANIQPTKFNDFASGICSINSRLGVTAENSLIDALQSTSNKKNLTDLFNSELCREYLLTSSEIQPQLEEICSLAVELKEDGSWVKTGFGEDIGRLCECYFPDAYYQWYKTDSGILTEDEVSSAVDKVRPECFHMGCARSGNYSVTENAECPDVYKCIQTINNNSPPVDVQNRFGAVARPSASEQNCNFNIINPAGGATLPVQTGGNPSYPSSGSSSGSDSSPDIPFNDNLGDGSGYDDDDGSSSDSGAFGRDKEKGVSSTGDDNTMMLLVGAMFCCSILVMIMMTMSGGGGRGRGMSYGQPPMPYGMY